MAGTNFLTWDAPQVNIQTDAQYASDSLRSNGAPTGAICPSPTFNKFALQASVFPAAFCEMLANNGISTNDSNQAVLAAALDNVVLSSDLPVGLQFVPYSPTLTLNGANVAAFYMPLNGNSAIQALINLTAGQKITMIYKQDATGGRVVTYPSNFFQAMTPDPAPGQISIQNFIYDPYEGQLYAAGPLINWNSLFIGSLNADTVNASGAITAASATLTGNLIVQSAAAVRTSLLVNGNTNIGSLQIAGGAPAGQVLTGDGTHYVPVAPTPFPARNSNGNGNWVVYPNGVIEQWGFIGPFGGSGLPNLSVTFPTPFSSGALAANGISVQISLDSRPTTGSDSGGGVWPVGLSTTGFTAEAEIDTGAATNVHAYWRAIGY